MQTKSDTRGPTLRKLWDEIRPKWLGYQERHPLVISITCYFDDSYRFDDKGRSGVFAVAGYIGSTEMWDEELSPGWAAVMNSAPHLLTEFKAADCRSLQGEFQGWSREECDEITKALIDVIAAPRYKGRLMGIGSAVEIPWTKSSTVRKKLLRWGYLWCIGNVMLSALEWAKRLDGWGAVHFIFDRQKGLQGPAEKIYDAICDSDETGTAGLLRVPQFEDSRHLAPLQAADLLAYETYKELYNRTADNPRPVSMALQTLVNATLHLGQYLEATELIGLLRMDGEPLKQLDGDIYRGPVLYSTASDPSVRPPRTQPHLGA